MKKIACIILIQLFLSALWALDYRQVLFSNNYERIEKVTDKESILGNGYDAIASTIKKKVDNSPCVLYEYPNFKYNELYTEKYANGNVYRLLITDEPISTDKILNMSFDYIDQVMFLKENKDFSNANYYEWKDVQNSKKYNLIRDNVYLFDGYHNRIEIKSTRPLIDKKRPLMYTIQNAFDGNSATAYVEDSDDDLLFISVYKGKMGKIKYLTVINGYSANEKLYFENNRVKEIGDYYVSSTGSKRIYSNKTAVLEDIFGTKQKVDFYDSLFAITEIYKGTKYTDTCISELDFFIDKQGLLFGE